MQEVQANYTMMDMVLKNQRLFDHVVSTLFSGLDKDGNGTLEFSELKEYMDKICSEVGVKRKPKDSELEKIFSNLDEDGNKTICKEEMAKFLRSLLEKEKKRL